MPIKGRAMPNKAKPSVIAPCIRLIPIIPNSLILAVPTKGILSKSVLPLSNISFGYFCIIRDTATFDRRTSEKVPPPALECLEISIRVVHKDNCIR